MISEQREETERGVCSFCKGLLPRLGYYWTCHVCGEAYCYIHMDRHSKGGHARRPTDSHLTITPNNVM